MRLEKARFVLGQIAHGMIRPQKEINKAVDTVFSELDKRKWIPVTERLPEEDGHYIVAIKNGWFPNNVIPIDILRYEGGKWKYYFGFENDDFEDDDFENPITAWMPLPEAYEGGDA